MRDDARPWTAAALAACCVMAGACETEEPDQINGQEPVGTLREPAAEEQEGEQPATEGEPAAAGEERGEPDAKATLQAAEGENVGGEVTFYSQDEGVLVVADVKNASPGLHGFHIHEKGDCSNISGESMGGHYAPRDNEHGLPSQDPHHLGDMGNLEVKEDGSGRLEFTINDASLEPDADLTVMGKAVVLHQGEDMGQEKQPSGSSGSPIACGAIEEAN